jgi:ribosomal protein L24E
MENELAVRDIEETLDTPQNRQIQCLYCGKNIPNPRVGKGEILQRFCDKKCRWAYHDRRKTKSHWKQFVSKLLRLLEEYGVEVIE